MDARKQRGQQTKEKILLSAVELFHKKGVNATSVDDVLEFSKTGKSQFYHFFGSKEQLVKEVMRYHGECFRHIREGLRDIQNYAQFEQWYRASLNSALEDNEFYGCPIGALASEMSLNNEEMRLEVDRLFLQWQDLFARCFAVLKAHGELNAEADPDRLAEFFVAAFQGSSLLAKTRGSQELLVRSMDNTLAYLRTFRVQSH